MIVGNFTANVPYKNAAGISAERPEFLKPQFKSAEISAGTQADKPDFQKIETGSVIRLDQSNTEQSDYNRGSVLDILV